MAGGDVMSLRKTVKANSSHTYRVQYDNHGDYKFGTGISFIDGNLISGPDIERAVNGKSLPDEGEDDRIWE